MVRNMIACAAVAALMAVAPDHGQAAENSAESAAPQMAAVLEGIDRSGLNSAVKPFDAAAFRQGLLHAVDGVAEEGVSAERVAAAIATQYIGQTDDPAALSQTLAEVYPGAVEAFVAALQAQGHAATASVVAALMQGGDVGDGVRASVARAIKDTPAAATNNAGSAGLTAPQTVSTAAADAAEATGSAPSGSQGFSVMTFEALNFSSLELPAQRAAQLSRTDRADRLTRFTAQTRTVSPVE